MLDTAWSWAELGAVVNILFGALPFVEFEFGTLAGCFRFLDELDPPFPSSILAENDEVPGIESLEAKFAPFAAA